MKTAVYPGTFDPITNGHIDLVRRGLTIADRLIVAVSTGGGKDPLFSLAERVAQVRRAVAPFRRVTVEPFDGLLVHYLRRRQAHLIIRGLRAVSDFEYEFQMALMNRRMSPDVVTVYLMPAERYTYLSSSVVRELAQFGGRLTGLVPPHVARELKTKLAARRSRR